MSHPLGILGVPTMTSCASHPLTRAAVCGRVRAKMNKYEYTQKYVLGHYADEAINGFAKQGWEVVCTAISENVPPRQVVTLRRLIVQKPSIMRKRH